MRCPDGRVADDLTGLVPEIAALARGVARSPSFDPSTPFALMGIDSLGVVELAAAIEHRTGLEVPIELMVDCVNSVDLAARLREHCPANREVASHHWNVMMADAILPPDVRPDRALIAASAGLAESSCILLTGATGFLGSWTAVHLLARSSATLICPVRPGTDGAARLRARLRACGADEAAIARRVEAIDADLAHPSLGLDHQRLDEIAGRVDAILHAAAAVNWVLPYRALRAANVVATLELLRLACARGIRFHFVSSLSVCYSTGAPLEVDETFDPRPHCRGLHLGYAASKAIAEALVAEAGRRGLPVSIYRPSLVSGHSAHGDFNADDVLSRLVRGCVRMGAAPDLDWRLDSLPVDVVADRIVALSTHTGTFHLVHNRPRHWRECLLWMRLRGYGISLLPYRSWLRRLERDLADDPAHPLAPLRSFLFDSPPEAGGLTLPELYEGSRRTTATAHRTASLVEGRSVPELDAALLDTYFRAFVARGHVPSTSADREVLRESACEPLDAAFFARVLGGDGRKATVTSARVRGSGAHSIIGELTAWRSARPTGVFRYELKASDCRLATDVAVKIKPRDDDARAVAEALAWLCDEQVGPSFSRWRDRLGLAGAQARELAVYRQRDPRFLRHLPALLGAIVEPSGQCVLVLEALTDTVLLDAVDRPREWTGGHTATVIEGLARVHAVWYGRERELAQQAWIGHVATTRTVVEMADLWHALAAHAAPLFSSWSQPAIADIHQVLARDVATWWPGLERLPGTLVHGDCNPRNLCLRRRGHRLELCLYDWELATLGSPARDLAELLCFVLPPDASDAQIDMWVDAHRACLEAETSRRIDESTFRGAFAASLYDILLRRLPIYALVHRVRPQSFLPRVVRTWLRMYERFPWRAAP